MDDLAHTQADADLSRGAHVVAIPGPSMVPDAVLRAMHRASPNIYQGELVDLTHSLIPDLKRVARTEHQATIYIGNGHAAWEAGLTNTHARGDLVLVPDTGNFAQNWAGTARGLGLRVEMLAGGDDRAALDPARVGARLREDAGHEIRSVLMVHTDTSTSLKVDMAAVRREMDAAGHPALLHADCIASLACDRFEMDDWGVDVAITGCQKGLMVPAGVCFVFYNDRADRARERADLATPYWDWRPRTNPEVYFRYFNGTGPTHHLYGLRAALDLLMDEGMERVWARHDRLAGAVWDALDAWSAPGGLEANVRDRAHRSSAVTTVRLDQGRATRLREAAETLGTTLGIGVGMAPLGTPEWHGFFRIGHMGHLAAHSLLGTLGVVETGLVRLGVPMGGSGTAAAAKALA